MVVGGGAASATAAAVSAIFLCWTTSNLVTALITPSFSRWSCGGDGGEGIF